MSFNVEISITDGGSRPNDRTFTVYGNLDGYVTPIQSGITKTELTNTETPYFILVDDGTTTLRLVDDVEGCYIDIVITNGDFCGVANFTFTSAETNLIGSIDVGDLLGNTSGLTDYRIFWYNETNDIAYISGYGNEFTPYNFTHPLTGSSAIFAQEGTYSPVVDKVSINGVNYSQTGDTLDPVVVNMQDCLDDYTVIVDSFDCSNGEGYLLGEAYYEHRKTFTAIGNGSLALESTFELSANTNYFAWAFKAFSVTDSIKLTFIGSEYSEPIGLDYITLGGSNNNTQFNTLPYNFTTGSFWKNTTCLTGLTVNSGDKIVMEIIPNEVNNQTSWDYYFTCLSSFDQNLCGNEVDIFKINSNTLSVTDNGCNTTFSYSVSGCSYDDILDSDFGKYLNIGNNVSTSKNLIFNHDTYDCNVTTYARGNFTCQEINQYNITKSGSLLTYTFTDFADFEEFVNNYEGIKEDVWYTSNIPNDNEYQFYNQIRLVTYITPSLSCGDGTTYQFEYIHPSSTTSSGTTGSDWIFTIDMVSITNNYTGDTCECYNTINNSVNIIGNTINATDFNYEYTNGLFNSYMSGTKRTNVTTGNPATLSFNSNSSIYLDVPSNETKPFSGVTSTPNALEYSGITFNGFNENVVNIYDWRKTRIYYYYNISFDVYPYNNFIINAAVPDGSGYYDLNNPTFIPVYSGNVSDPTNGTIIDSDYVY